MPARIQFSGPAWQQARSMAKLCRSAIGVCARRTLKGRLRPGWNLAVELSTAILKERLRTAFRMNDVNQTRRYLDSVFFTSPALSRVVITRVANEKFKGSWFVPKSFQGTEKAKTQPTMLYLHGGGYSFYPKGYDSLIAAITRAASCTTFALDYRLAPEHRFPAQLEDALSAYRWLLENGTHADELVVAGDSAGGNLTLALLTSVRDAKLPLPALGIALSPPTDFEADVANSQNAAFDWIDQEMLLKWSDWYCSPEQRRNPLVSPLYADLRGLPPIYMQAGAAEILYDSIQRFAERARSQGVDVVLETWADMNHNFQMFGYQAPQSREALRRLGEVVAKRMRELQPTRAR